MVATHNTKICADFALRFKVVYEGIQHSFKIVVTGTLDQTIFGPDFSIHLDSP